MKVLVTGGAGFIGRWVVAELISRQIDVAVLDNLTNGSLSNLDAFAASPHYLGITIGSVTDERLLDQVFMNGFTHCFHLAASINVQDSIDDPSTTFQNDTVGTFLVLERCRQHRCKFLLMSTCMVYAASNALEGIDEQHPIKPASPYAGSKIAAESLALSYWHAYGLPVVVVRPFNTYGPYQKAGGEGGVISIFLNKALVGEPVSIYGSGEQTRDFLYVEDCARFVVDAGLSCKVDGEIINAGTGMDITINELALMITGKKEMIRHVPHIHPQSEIMRLSCNFGKARELLGWTPQYTLSDGIDRMKQHNGKKE